MFVPLPVCRSVLLLFFLWRLRVEKPSIVVLFADAVVWDNEDAARREGVEPTCKKKKGFQPLQISWGPYVVDALFRSGRVHRNHGIELNHQRGKSELNHRSQKEFAGKEQFPFESFGMNQVHYYFLLFSHLLYEAHKYDVTLDIHPGIVTPQRSDLRCWILPSRLFQRAAGLS